MVYFLRIKSPDYEPLPKSRCRNTVDDAECVIMCTKAKERVKKVKHLRNEIAFVTFTLRKVLKICYFLVVKECTIIDTKNRVVEFKTTIQSNLRSNFKFYIMSDTWTTAIWQNRLFWSLPRVVVEDRCFDLLYCAIENKNEVACFMSNCHVIFMQDGSFQILKSSFDTFWNYRSNVGARQKVVVPLLVDDVAGTKR